MSRPFEATLFRTFIYIYIYIYIYKIKQKLTGSCVIQDRR